MIDRRKKENFSGHWTMRFSRLFADGEAYNWRDIGISRHWKLLFTGRRDGASSAKDTDNGNILFAKFPRNYVRPGNLRIDDKNSRSKCELHRETKVTRVSCRNNRETPSRDARKLEISESVSRAARTHGTCSLLIIQIPVAGSDFQRGNLCRGGPSAILSWTAVRRYFMVRE